MNTCYCMKLFCTLFTSVLYCASSSTVGNSKFSKDLIFKFFSCVFSVKPRAYGTERNTFLFSSDQLPSNEIKAKPITGALMEKS